MRSAFLWLCLLPLPATILTGLALSAWAEQAPISSRPRIRQIRIAVRDIFEEQDIGSFYRCVNSLKVSTREEVIRRELLFEEGDEFSQFLLEESERNLRRLPFVRKAAIVAIRDGEWVDLVVTTQDTWTLYPFLSISSGSGAEKRAVGLSENNVLGYGKRFEILVADDEGREKMEGVWDDNRLLGTQQHLTLGHFNRSDGFRTIALYGKPFRSLADKEAWEIDTDVSDLVGRLFVNGEERYIFRQRHRSIRMDYTRSSGNPEVLIRRYGLGYDYSDDVFSEADEDDYEDVDVDPGSVSHDPGLLADDRRFSGPSFAFEMLEPDYLSINYIDRFGRVEDFNLGSHITGRAVFAFDALGSVRDTALLAVNATDGRRFGPISFVRGDAALATTLDGYGFANTVFHGQLNYYAVLGDKYWGGIYTGKHTVASEVSLTIGNELDRDKELLLGADNGLRGYESRTFTGDRRLIANLEDRFHLVENVLRLFDIGGVFFFDCGGTTSRGLDHLVSHRIFADVGFGLRLGLPRSAGGSVIRFDIAYPLREGPDGSAVLEPRFLISTGQLFPAKLPSDLVEDTSSRVRVNFLE